MDVKVEVAYKSCQNQHDVSGVNRTKGSSTLVLPRRPEIGAADDLSILHQFSSLFTSEKIVPDTVLCNLVDESTMPDEHR